MKRDIKVTLPLAADEKLHKTSHPKKKKRKLNTPVNDLDTTITKDSSMEKDIKVTLPVAADEKVQKTSHPKKKKRKLNTSVNDSDTMNDVKPRLKKSSINKIEEFFEQSFELPDTDDDAENMSDSESDLDETEPADRSEQRAHRQLQNEAMRRTVFVGNLPPGVQKKELRKLFQRQLDQDNQSVNAGCRVETVRIRCAIAATGGTGKLARRRAAIQDQSEAGVSQARIAYVLLTSAIGIKAATSLNGHFLETNTSTPSAEPPTGEEAADPVDSPTGRYIRVDRAFGNKQRKIQTDNCVFLGNIPFNAMEDEIRTSMSIFGPITNVRLIRDKIVGAVKGFGFVQFTDPTAVPLAIRATGTVNIRGRPIRIQQWSSQQAGNTSTKPQYVERAAKKRISTTVEEPREESVREHKPKSWHNLAHTGQVRGITLPSNLRGSQREQFLEKRLLKKRKRRLFREQQNKIADKAKDNNINNNKVKRKK